jgi:hypothetical protein
MTFNGDLPEVSCQQWTLTTQAAAGCLLKFWANTAGAIGHTSFLIRLPVLERAAGELGVEAAHQAGTKVNRASVNLLTSNRSEERPLHNLRLLERFKM